MVKAYHKPKKKLTDYYPLLRDPRANGPPQEIDGVPRDEKGFVICPITMKNNIRSDTMQLVLQYRKPVFSLKDRHGKKLKR
jgi:hypothetical protein